MADIDDQLRSHGERLAALEVWKATAMVEQPYMEKRFDALDRQFEKWNGNLNKAIWLVAASGITAMLAFIFKGGLAP